MTKTKKEVDDPFGLDELKGRRTPGDALVPDLSKFARGIEKEYFYWVGVLPSCPVEYIDLAGINFPKINENIIPASDRTGGTQRVPVIGSITLLTEKRLELMREVLPRTVIRFFEAPGVQEEPGTGQNLGDLHVRPRKGHRITIPTDKEIEIRRKQGRPARLYVPGPHDEPAARYMFAQLCKDQEHPERGDHYPDTLDITGLEWPKI